MRSKRFDGVVIHFVETDAAWSASVLAKSDGWCVLCGKPATPAHIISRRYAPTRLAVENGQPLCVKCHRWYDELPPGRARHVACLLVGPDVFDVLQRLSVTGREVTKWE